MSYCSLCSHPCKLQSALHCTELAAAVVYTGNLGSGQHNDENGCAAMATTAWLGFSIPFNHIALGRRPTSVQWDCYPHSACLSISWSWLYEPWHWKLGHRLTAMNMVVLPWQPMAGILMQSLSTTLLLEEDLQVYNETAPHTVHASQFPAPAAGCRNLEVIAHLRDSISGAHCIAYRNGPPGVHYLKEMVLLPHIACSQGQESRRSCATSQYSCRSSSKNSMGYTWLLWSFGALTIPNVQLTPNVSCNIDYPQGNNQCIRVHVFNYKRIQSTSGSCQWLLMNSCISYCNLSSHPLKLQSNQV